MTVSTFAWLFLERSKGFVLKISPREHACAHVQKNLGEPDPHGGQCLSPHSGAHRSPKRTGVEGGGQLRSGQEATVGSCCLAVGATAVAGSRNADLSGDGSCGKAGACCGVMGWVEQGFDE
jgi:hypothetical protein